MKPAIYDGTVFIFVESGGATVLLKLSRESVTRLKSEVSKTIMSIAVSGLDVDNDPLRRPMINFVQSRIILPAMINAAIAT